MSGTKSHEFLPHPRPYYPWLVLLISLLFQYYKQLLLASPSVMVIEVSSTFNLNSDALGLLIGMAMYSFFIFQIPFGILIDKFGVRRITSLGILICAIGATLFGYSYSLTSAYIGRFLIGLGASVALVNVVKILSNWFQPKLFAFLMSIAITVGLLGDLTGLYLTQSIVNAVGWRITMMNYGLIGLIFAIIFFIFVKDTDPGAQYDINPKIQRLKLSSTILRMLKRKQSWVIALFAGFAQTPFPVFIGLWGISYLKSITNFTTEQAVTVYAFLLGGACISMPAIAYLSTYLKKRKIFIVIGALGSTLFSALIAARIIPPSYTYYILIFFLHGIFCGGLSLCVAVMKEQNVALISATAFAFINSTYAIFGATVEQFAGIIFNYKWNTALFNTPESLTPHSYFTFLLRAPFWLGLAFIFSLFIKETYAKQKLKEDISREPRKQT